MTKLVQEIRLWLMTELIYIAARLVPENHPEELEWMQWFSKLPNPKK